MKNFAGYPEFDFVVDKFNKIPSQLIDTDPLLQGFKQGMGTLLLGKAALQLPIKRETWGSVIADLFTAKGAVIVEKNINAFNIGQGL